jgi:hypothetical protein
MHWPIIHTLIGKELLRLAGNRGALAVAGLLLTCGLLLAVLDPANPTGGAGGRLQTFWVDSWQDSPWVEYLRANVPPELRDQVRFRRVSDIPTDRHGTLQYGRGEGAVQLRPLATDGSLARTKVWFWYAGDDASVLAPYEEWFWRETHRYCREQAVAALPTDRRPDADAVRSPNVSSDPARLAQELHRLYRERLSALAPDAVAAVLPEVEDERSALRGLEPRQAAATGLVLFSLFFACALVLPSVTCEEKERGTLLAQLMSPASAADMLAAKAVVYAGLGIVLAAVPGVLAQPALGQTPFFWLTLATAACGAFGLGITFASLARTQRAASTGAMSYALAVAVLTVVGQRSGIPGLTFVLLESHLPPLFYAVLNDAVAPQHWQSLGVAAVLAAVWVGVGAILFRRSRWQ